MQQEFLSHEMAAQRNRNSILHYIRKYAPISRTDIWNNMNMSRASVTQVIRQLEEENLIAQSGEGVSTGGRRPQYIRINADARKIIGFDWNSKTLCLMNLDGDVLWETYVPFRFGVNPSVFAAELKEQIKELFRKNPFDRQSLLGFGLALPALVDFHKTTVVYSAQMNWRNVCVKDLFYDLFGDAVYLEKAGNALVMGEYHYGVCKGTKHMQLHMLGDDGISVSTVVHGACLHGANFMYGELGHTKLHGSKSICSCGQAGCLEAVISDLYKRSGEMLTDEILGYLAEAVAGSINISDVSAAILAGSFVDMMDDDLCARFLESIDSKITSRDSRKLRYAFMDDPKTLALRGITAMVFECCFAIS